MVLYYKHF